jgi:hypothetical protein
VVDSVFVNPFEELKLLTNITLSGESGPHRTKGPSSRTTTSGTSTTRANRSSADVMSAGAGFSQSPTTNRPGKLARAS